MVKEAVSPPKIMKSVHSPEPSQRVADLPGFVSLELRELFPDIAEEIYLRGNDLSVVRKATEDALAGVNMDMIQTKDTVNILCSEHGFNILEGEPYAEMLRTIKDVVQERTGCKIIRLRVGVGFGSQEATEIIEHYRLGQYFNRRAVGMGPHDKGVPIETEIGTLYGIARAYDADWVISAHFNDMCRVGLHRLMDRVLKPFVMNYARAETRAVYHRNFGSRSSNFVPRAIFNSPFIQQRFALACALMTSPAGVVGVDADNDLNQFDRRQTVVSLKSYGKLIRLFGEIDECIAVLDGVKWVTYVMAGGLSFADLTRAKSDFLDLTSTSAGLPAGHSIKALVINHAWTGLNATARANQIPTIMVGRELSDRFIADSTNPHFMSHAVTAETLETALEFAHRIAKTDNVIVFDGSLGSINLSQSLAEYLLKKAPAVSRKVDEELLSKWLRQRGIDAAKV